MATNHLDLWVEYANGGREWHPGVPRDRSFVRSLLADPQVVFLAGLTVHWDGDCQYLSQDILKGGPDNSRQAIEFAQANLFADEKQ